MKKIIIYIDGGSRGNPGPSAVGVVFCNEKGEEIKRYSKCIGKGTNNEAEYKALIFALEKFKQVFGKKLARASEVEIRSDSQLLVKQLEGEYKVLGSNVQPLFIKAWNLRLDFKKVNLKLIPRARNKLADALVNQALDAQERQGRVI